MSNMYKHLYECFKHWHHGGQIFFYSDPHFGDAEMQIARKKNNNFITDDEQVKRINSTVHKNDTIVFLGDIGDVEYVKKLKAGYKVLVMGNHDKGASNYRRSIEWAPCDKCDPYIIKDNKLFDEVYEGPLMISDKILLSHEPIKFEYALNIHGHDHNGKNDLAFLKFNVCAEKINYTPVMLKAVIESGMIKNVPNIHREVIDKAVAKKKKIV